MSEEPSKIIVDDDWKAQVEKEKRLAAEAKSSEAKSVEAKSTEAKSAEFKSTEVGNPTHSAEPSPAQSPPPATFETLVSMLFTQGMAALGQMIGDDQQPLPVNKPFAKHFIDSIEMLGEKTKGNLTEQESAMLADVLHALRMTFVSVKAK